MKTSKKTINKRTFAVIMTVLMSLALCLPVFAAEPDSAGNIFESGDTISFSNMPFFGALGFGKNIDVNGSTALGSVFACGETVRVEGSTINESLYAGAGTVTITDTSVNGNLYTAGDSITISGQTVCNGLYAAGNTILFEGEAARFLAGGNKVILSGTINGDAEIHASEVEISPDLTVTGQLKINSENEPAIPEEAQIRSYSFKKMEVQEETVIQVSKRSVIRQKVAQTIYWVVAMAAFGLVLCWLFGDHLTRAGQYLKERTGPMIGSGIIGWICIPIAAIILCCTIILAPIGGLLLLAYVILLCAGLAFTGASLARLIFPNMNVFLSATIGIAVLEIVKAIPVIGNIVGVIADMYLIAYVIQHLWEGRLKKQR